ncbi:hypothetical protein EVA_18176 [gut metagenome]|uniref:Uncharacterized protein n=1 Tax=gut metagenome TaxID=749906 RepID=J9FVW9_9ZZZZ
MPLHRKLAGLPVPVSLRLFSLSRCLAVLWNWATVTWWFILRAAVVCVAFNMVMHGRPSAPETADSVCTIDQAMNCASKTEAKPSKPGRLIILFCWPK